MGIFSKRRRKNAFRRNGSLLRWLGPGATTGGLFYLLYLFLTGGLSFSALDRLLPADAEASFRGEPVSLGAKTDRSQDQIRIATFNIENFGEKKSGTRVNEHGTDELGTIARIVSTFDLVAIQELRGADGLALRRLIDLLNESGGTYAATISDPLGDQNRYESYAFVWDQSRIQLVPGSAYVVLDQGDRMYREPMVASFQSRVPQGADKPPFRFTVINVHTDPDRVDASDRESEINVLADVFHRVRQYEFEKQAEDDFILLGDLNVDPDGLGALAAIPGVISLGGDIKTNVPREKTNDHILIDRNVTREYAGRMGVIDFQADLGLERQQADSISDHLPLWAEFDRFETPPPRTAAAPASGPGTRVIQ